MSNSEDTRTTEQTELQRIDLLAGSTASGGCCSPGGCACGAQGDAQRGAQADGRQGSAVTADADVVTEYLVEGMTCAHCVASVTEELSELAGVDSVGIELAVGGASRVTVASAVALDVASVRAAVEEAGYTLVADAR